MRQGELAFDRLFLGSAFLTGSALRFATRMIRLAPNHGPFFARRNANATLFAPDPRFRFGKFRQERSSVGIPVLPRRGPRERSAGHDHREKVL